MAETRDHAISQAVLSLTSDVEPDRAWEGEAQTPNPSRIRVDPLWTAVPREACHTYGLRLAPYLAWGQDAEFTLDRRRWEFHGQGLPLAVFAREHPIAMALAFDLLPMMRDFIAAPIYLQRATLSCMAGGATITPHFDLSPSSQYTASVLIYSTMNAWDIIGEMPGYPVELRTISMRVGDVMIGTPYGIRHWRGPFEGSLCIRVLARYTLDKINAYAGKRIQGFDRFYRRARAGWRALGFDDWRDRD